MRLPMARSGYGGTPHGCQTPAFNRPGDGEAERERMFDRFYQPGSDGAQGSSLGLAIIRGVAERHGATVMLGDSALGGLRVVVRFGQSSAPL